MTAEAASDAGNDSASAIFTVYSAAATSASGRDIWDADPSTDSANRQNKK